MTSDFDGQSGAGVMILDMEGIVSFHPYQGNKNGIVADAVLPVSNLREDYCFFSSAGAAAGAGAAAPPTVPMTSHLPPLTW